MADGSTKLTSADVRAALVLRSSDDRAEKRSETYAGVAEAMASQWGDYLARDLFGAAA